jgi:cytosine/creatinine deaminase
METFMDAAVAEAQKGRDAGGVPIGSVLVIDDAIVGRGHNQRVQKGSVVLHAEMDCLENAGRLKATDYRKATIYSTLSPCSMCTGAILLYGIPTVVVGDRTTFSGPQHLLEQAGVDVHVLDDIRCVSMMERFISEHPDLWNEDIGE